MSSHKRAEIPSAVLDDLCCRFALHLPLPLPLNTGGGGGGGARSTAMRACFQMEQAHWFYLDFCVPETQGLALPRLGIKAFAQALFQHCPFFPLPPGTRNVGEVVEQWIEYKSTIPTYGAVILDEALESVLLVQGYHSMRWGFPKGKINEGEAPGDCARREVLEETGFDVKGRLRKDVYVEHESNGRLARLYVVPRVSRDTVFRPQTRGEIKDIRWFPVQELTSMAFPPNKFLLAVPFVRPLREWIAKLRRGESVYSKGFQPF